jgi:hypothetical protein
LVAGDDARAGIVLLRTGHSPFEEESMRSRPMMLAGGLLLLAVAAYAPVAIARQATSAHAAAGYSSNERDFTVGRTVYLRSTKTKIGRIIAADEHREFPPGFRARPGRAVLLRHVDGPMDWLPVEGLSRVYVVR